MRQVWPIMLVCSLMTVSVTFADEPAGAPWLEAQIARSKTIAIPENIRVRWRHEIHRMLMDHEVLDLRAKIAGKPDHPDRFRLLPEEIRIRSGPEILDWELLYGDSQRWRINRGNRSTESYADMGYNRGSAWQLTPGQAQLIHEASAPAGYEPGSRRGDFEGAMKHFVLGPYFLAPRFEYSATSFQAGSGGRYIAVVERSPDRRIFHFMRDIDREGRVFVERRSFDSEGLLSSIDLYYEIENPDPDAVFAFVSGSRHHPDGTIAHVFALESVDRLSQQDLRAALAPPAFGRIDMFRGDFGGAQLVDLRGGVPTVYESDPDGVVTGYQPVVTSRAENPGDTLWRIAGWVSGIVLLVVGVVFWRIKRGGIN